MLKLNNLELALCMTFKFYKSVVETLKLKVRKFLGLIPRFLGVTADKLLGVFLPRGRIYSKFS